MRKDYFEMCIASDTYGKEFVNVEGCRVIILNKFAGKSYLLAEQASGAIGFINHFGEEVVVLSETFVRAVDPLVAMVAIYHEVGHHKAGHIKAANAAGKVGIAELNEVEADLFPVMKFGKKQVLRAHMAIAAYYGKTRGLPPFIGKLLFISFNFKRILKLL